MARPDSPIADRPDATGRERLRAWADVVSAHARPNRSTLIWGIVLVSVQAYLVLTYVSITGRQGGVDSFVLVPFVWINVALWAFVRTSPKPVSGRDRILPTAIAGGYFLLLALVGGLVGPGAGFSDAVPATDPRLILFDAPPGWTPAFVWAGEYLRVALRPPLVLGYAAIAYLLYATITEMHKAVLGGIVGLFSCVGCTVPIIVAVVGAVTGGTAGLLTPGNVAAISGYEVSTVVFLVTIGFLYVAHLFATDE